MNLNKENFIAGEDSTIADYYQLMKPRVMFLVVFTAIVGMILAPGELSLFPLLAGVFAIALGSGASGAFNMWYESDIDHLMKRTMKRPLPSGKILLDDGLAFSIFCAIFSLMIMFLVGNNIATYLLVFAMFFYGVIYTMFLKPYTSQNIVIGGIAGSLPPLIGWHFVSPEFNIVPVILFLIIFLWTPPHFWALSLKTKDEYAKAGIPMMPITHGNRATKKQMIFYSVLLLLVNASLYFIGYSSVVFFFLSGLLNIYFIYLCYKLYQDSEDKLAMKVFYYSIFYLFAIFMLLIIDIKIKLLL